MVKSFSWLTVVILAGFLNIRKIDALHLYELLDHQITLAVDPPSSSKFLTRTVMSISSESISSDLQFLQEAN